MKITKKNGTISVYDAEKVARSILNANANVPAEAITPAMAAALGKEPEDVGARADFFLDLGGSSLDYFALISALRAEYGVDFPTEDGSSLSTAEALAAYIRSAGAYVD